MSEPRLFESRHDLPAAVRARMVALLQSQLTDALDLASQVKHAHWNVKGPHFLPLHELFDEMHERLEESIDDVAERLTALGGHAQGTLRQGAATTRLPEFPAEAIDGSAHLKALSERFAHLAQSTRVAIDTASAAGDAGTADIFTQVSRQLDKDLWFLESHLQR